MFHLFVASPEEVIYDGPSNNLTAPGTAGYFEILTGHAPFISSLAKGRVEFVDAEGKKYLYEIPGGVIEVDHNEVSLLVDAIVV